MNPTSSYRTRKLLNRISNLHSATAASSNWGASSWQRHPQVEDSNLKRHFFLLPLFTSFLFIIMSGLDVLFILSSIFASMVMENFRFFFCRLQPLSRVFYILNHDHSSFSLFFKKVFFFLFCRPLTRMFSPFSRRVELRHSQVFDVEKLSDSKRIGVGLASSKLFDIM